MLELFVWDAAFELPSIDAECLATIAYLCKTAPASSWRLVPSNDPSISPASHFPALNHDGIWTSGFDNIVSYLTSHSLITPLDADLTPRQKADGKAFQSFIATRTAPLLDLSLYVSAGNWSATTRPAYSRILHFPLTWTLPPLIRHEALQRTEHLGLAELDTDFDPNAGLHLSTGRESLPESFRRHLPVVGKKTVREEMTPEQATAIRLFSLAENGLALLEELLAEHDGYLLRPQLSSVDCFAFGYLALMLDAPVPRAFLKEWIGHKAPRIQAFVASMKSQCFSSPDQLPIPSPRNGSFTGAVGQMLDTCVLNAPGIGEHYATEKRHRREQGITGVDGRAFMLAVSVMVTGVAMGYGFMYYKAMPPFGARVQTWRAARGGNGLSQFGDLGLMLNSALGAQSSPMASAGNAPAGRLAEMDSDVD